MGLKKNKKTGKPMFVKAKEGESKEKQLGNFYTGLKEAGLPLDKTGTKLKKGTTGGELIKPIGNVFLMVPGVTKKDLPGLPKGGPKLGEAETPFDNGGGGGGGDKKPKKPKDETVLPTTSVSPGTLAIARLIGRGGML